MPGLNRFCSMERLHGGNEACASFSDASPPECARCLAHAVQQTAYVRVEDNTRGPSKTSTRARFRETSRDTVGLPHSPTLSWQSNQEIV